jgi:hypothetical protein
VPLKVTANGIEINYEIAGNGPWLTLSHSLACNLHIGTPVAMAREINGAMPGSELVIIASAAHLSNIEQPQPFNAALLCFLGRVAN